MPVFARRIGWIDVNGDVRTTQVLGNATLTSFEAALLLMSNADEATESEAQIFVNATPLPVNATYKSVTDQAELWFQTTAGTIVSVTLPAPHSSIFLADQVTVDPANANVVSATTVATGLVTDLSGNAVASFIGGIRRKG